MRTSLFFFIFIIMVSCKKERNYDIALEFFNKGEYDKASIYLNIIDSSDVDFQNAKLKLDQIREIKDGTVFQEGLDEFNEDKFDDAQLSFSNIENNSSYFEDAQKYLLEIENIRKGHVKSTEKHDDKFNLAKDRLIKLYKELLSFKNNKDFHEFGFAVNYKYNRWMKDVEKLRDNQEIVDKLYDDGYPVIDLLQMGLAYRGSAGEETDFTKYVKNTYKGIRKINK